jgi:hypothetical protein
MKKFTVMFLFAFMIGTGSALAGIIEVGDPWPANSWGQAWSENGMLPKELKPYNKIVITMVAPPTLEYAVPQTAGWLYSQVETNGFSQVTMWSVSGSHSGRFDFITMFYDTPATPVSFTYQVFMNEDRLSLQVATWNPSTETWSYAYPNNCVMAVPEAGFLPLLLIGLAGVLLISRRQLKPSGSWA